MNKEDSPNDCKSPFGVMRCARGGKTRTLLELASSLAKKEPDTIVLFVSCNDNTSVEKWEKGNPLGAICRHLVLPLQPEGLSSNQRMSCKSLVIADWVTINDGCVVLFIDGVFEVPLFKPHGKSFCVFFPHCDLGDQALYLHDFEIGLDCFCD
jgi:hypothetical protein